MFSNKLLRHSNNYQLIQVLKKAKRDKDSSSYAKIMRAAQRLSPYERGALDNLGSIMSQKFIYDSTGGTETIQKRDVRNSSALEIQNSQINQYNDAINSNPLTMKSHRQVVSLLNIIC